MKRPLPMQFVRTSNQRKNAYQPGPQPQQGAQQ